MICGPFCDLRPPKGPARARLFAALAAAALVASVACGGARHDYSTLPSLTSSNEGAERDLRAAHEAAEAGRAQEAMRRYRFFIENYPEDPLLPAAKLGLGRVLMAEGEVEAALAEFEPLLRHPTPEVAEAGRFYRGVALHLLGQSDEALSALVPLQDRATDPDDRVLLLQTIAAAARRAEAPLIAFRALDRLIAVDGIDPTVAEAARTDLAEVVAQASAEAIEQAYRVLDRDGAAFALVAVRAIRLAFAAGDTERVRAMMRDIRAHQVPMTDELETLATQVESVAEADPRIIGAILPLTGPGRAIGQQALQGLMLASGVPAAFPPAEDAPQLILRDDGGDPERAARAVEELATVHRAVAIIGPLNGTTAPAAADRARALSIPLLTLVPNAEVADGWVFRLLATPTEECRRLVSEARSRGAYRFAALFPDHPYGRAMRDTFARVVAETGGTLVGEASYPAGATSFGPMVEQLAGVDFDALFLPDEARRITLIGPALAAADLWSTRTGGRAPGDGRPITLLVPSVGLDQSVARRSARYLQGALFTAPFFEATAGVAGLEFAEGYRNRFGEAPSLFAAYAYDAFRWIHSAVREGYSSRSDVLTWLADRSERETAGASGGLSPNRGPVRPVRLVELVDDAFIAVTDP